MVVQLMKIMGFTALRVAIGETFAVVSDIGEHAPLGDGDLQGRIRCVRYADPPLTSSVSMISPGRFDRPFSTSSARRRMRR